MSEEFKPRAQDISKMIQDELERNPDKYPIDRPFVNPTFASRGIDFKKTIAVFYEIPNVKRARYLLEEAERTARPTMFHQMVKIMAEILGTKNPLAQSVSLVELAALCHHSIERLDVELQMLKDSQEDPVPQPEKVDGGNMAMTEENAAGPAINYYVCDKCRKLHITKDLDKGTTPFTIGCRADGCDGMATSSMYRVPQDSDPMYYWIRLTEDERLERAEKRLEENPEFAKYLKENDRDPLAHVLNSIEDHHNNSGLFMVDEVPDRHK
jgi:hypothetical protein